jgi:hypothetical protein
VTVSGYRFEIDATAGPGRERVLDGSLLLVRVRLFNGADVADAHTGEPLVREDVYTDLRPDEARELAFTLLSCAEQAERITQDADGWARR